MDTCLSTWAYRTSHPAVEPLVAALKYTNRDTGLDLKILAQLSEYLEKISPKYRHLLDERTSIIDINVLLHQTPGGMLSNLVNQLKEMDALDKLDEVFRQLPVVRKELGQVPLVTPTSQIVGVQAVQSVISENKGKPFYDNVSSQFFNLVKGVYGKTPFPIETNFRQKITGSRIEQPYDVSKYEKPENPELPEFENMKLAKNEKEELLLDLFPAVASGFLKRKREIEYKKMLAELEALRELEIKKIHEEAEKYNNLSEDEKKDMLLEGLYNNW